MLLKDLNVDSSDPVLNDSCNVYNLFSLVKEPTRFKNPYNPSCIDLFLTNHPRSFQNTLTIETVFTKNRNQKSFNTGATKTSIIRYFREKELNRELLKIDFNNADLSEFTEIFLSILDEHAPKKQKFIRANNSNFVTKSLRQAIMKRSKLRNKYLRERTNEAKNLCINKEISV